MWDYTTALPEVRLRGTLEVQTATLRYTALTHPMHVLTTALRLPLPLLSTTSASISVPYRPLLLHALLLANLVLYVVLPTFDRKALLQFCKHIHSLNVVPPTLAHVVLTVLHLSVTIHFRTVRTLWGPSKRRAPAYFLSILGYRLFVLCLKHRRK